MKINRNLVECPECVGAGTVLNTKGNKEVLCKTCNGLGMTISERAEIFNDHIQNK